MVERCMDILNVSGTARSRGGALQTRFPDTEIFLCRTCDLPASRCLAHRRADGNLNRGARAARLIVPVGIVEPAWLPGQRR